MIFIGIKKKTISYIVLAVILSLLVLSIYNSARIAENENRYQSVLSVTRMFEDTNFIAYMADEEAQRESRNIEVFDIAKGEVIRRTPLSLDLQNEVLTYVKSIKSLYTKAVPFPQKGYVIRVPFDPPVTVNLKPLAESGIKTLDQVFIIVSDREAPIMLVLDSKLRPYFYTFSASIQPLLDYLKINPEELSSPSPSPSPTQAPASTSGE
ncbi:MAG: hypothetical protein N2376_08800 [Clostridia bacterium]|nr:hypothetical protein [Clostridia bacterium]